MGIFSIISLFANVALVALQSAGVTTPALNTLIASLLASVGPLIGGLASGQGKTQDLMTILGTMSSVLGVLKTQTGLPPAILAQLDTLSQAIQAAAGAYVTSKSGVNLSILTPIEPIA